MNSIVKTIRSAVIALACGLPSGGILAVEPTLGMNEQPIHDAARVGTRTEVETILKRSPQARDARTELGITPLHYAAMNADSGPLKALLAAGATVNARENGKLLLDAGADPALKTDAGRDVLSMARKVRADELAGVISLWILKGCKAGKPC